MPSPASRNATRNTVMHVRPFAPGEEDTLRTIYFESVRQLARADYSAAQVAAWAPEDYDRVEWATRIQEVRPAVVVIDGQPVAFADLQASGYIDLFFVSPHHARRGIGTTLLAYLLQQARELGMFSVHANVSITAQPLFLRHGFRVEKINDVEVRGVTLQNATMRFLIDTY